MTKRTSGLVALGITAAVLLNGTIAYGSDLTWVISQATTTPVTQLPGPQTPSEGASRLATVLGGQVAGIVAQVPIPQTLWDLVQKSGKVPISPSLPTNTSSVFKFDGQQAGSRATNTPQIPTTIGAFGQGVAIQAVRNQTLWDLTQKAANLQLATNPQGYPSGAGQVNIISRDPSANSGLPPPTVSQNSTIQTAPVQKGPFTVWDIMQRGDPAHPSTVSLSGLANQMQIDPMTGRPINQPQMPKKKLTGFLKFFDSLGETSRQIGKKLNTQITVHGDKTIGYHAEKVGGSAQSYTNDNYYGVKGVGGSFNQTELTVQGKILGLLNFQTHYSDSPYVNPNENRLSLNYETKKLKFDAGDINGSITGNSLIDFNRTLKGIEVSAEVLKGLRITSLMSQTKAQTRTIVIQGANISGPYYVYAGQIVDGSEHVRINNIDQIKGIDYTLDPQTGELRFIKPGVIVHDTDAIAITFESYNFQQQAGAINGYRVDVAAIKHTKIGFEYLEQRTASGATALSTRTDQFYGYGSPLSPYVLTYSVNCTISKDSTGKPISAIMGTTINSS